MITGSLIKETVANSKLKEVFTDQLRELYWAEKKLAKTLGKMQEASSTAELKEAFRRNQEQTKGQVIRLVNVFAGIQEEPAKLKSLAMAGIISEIHDIIHNQEKESCSRDVALIMAAQKAKHFEIASYGGLAQLAQTMGYNEVHDLLEQTLQEEKETDSLLTLIAEGGINQNASMEPEHA